MDLAYADEGPGPVVVLLHGFPLSRAMWDEQLAGIGSIYRVIAPDLRGFGESPVPEGVYTMDAMADDVVELLETLEIMGPVVVGGLSMGGYVALSMAARYPTRVRGLDADGYPRRRRHARGGPGPRGDRPGRARGRQCRSPVVDAMLPRLFCEDDPGATSRAGRADEGRHGTNGTRKESPVRCAGMASRPDRRGDLPKIAVPTLVLVGEEDVITPPDEARAMAECDSQRPARGDPPGGPHGSLRKPIGGQRRDPPIPEESGALKFMADATPEAIITTPAQLKGLVDHLRAIGRFAFDTEFVSEETFEPVLCLIQVATRERLAVIDPLAVRDVSPFWDVVLDPSIEVVMHAAGEDLRICLLRTRALPRRVFDVQMAAGLAGLTYPLSLVNLVGQVLGISLAGSETRTDWRHRPLSAAQLNYALDDVRYLLDVADHFIDAAGATGSHGVGRGRVCRLSRVDRPARRRRPLAAAAGPASTEPAQPGDGPAAGRMARGRGAAPEPSAAPGGPRRSCSWPSPSASPGIVATWKRCATSTVRRS